MALRLLSVLGTLFLLAEPCPIFAQKDYTWWVNKHGISPAVPWQEVIVRSPGRMGPNALPVPPAGQACLDSLFPVEVAGEYHFSASEKTYNPFLQTQIPLAPQKVHLVFYTRPFEIWETDTLLRDYRFARERDAKGSSKGDVYFGFLTQILRNKKHWPDMLLTVVTKTATGNYVSSARHTDAPGYLIHLTIGKSFGGNSSNIRFPLNLSVGTFVWQNTSSTQNDAFFIGGNAGIEGKNHMLHTELSSYAGYLQNGDFPVVFRFRYGYRKGNMQYYLQYQRGIRDFIQNSVRCGLIINLAHTRPGRHWLAYFNRPN